MSVTSPSFFLFCLVAALVFNLSAAAWWRRAVLLAVNALFLVTFAHGMESLVPYAGFIGFGFAAQYITRDGARSRLFVALVFAILAMFFWLKRYSFIPSSTYLPYPYVIVGLSYVFFRVMHVLIDRHQRSIERPVGPVSFLNYTLNFTCLTSGPIQRYQDYQRSEMQCASLNLPVLGLALERIVRGYFKVAVVSMLLGSAQRQATEALAHANTWSGEAANGMLVAAIYPVYLYFNFSGYMDVVIGIARLFRIELPENFDRPFSSSSFIEFWSRWHITLSHWLKTYVYNPIMLVAMRRLTAPKLEPYISVLAFFVTFFLVGLWHGQTTEFLFFGFLQGGGVALNKLHQLLLQDTLGRKGYRALAANGIYRACGRGLTFTWFSFTLLWFWSSWGQIEALYGPLPLSALSILWLGIWGAATVILSAMGSVRSFIVSAWNRSQPMAPRYLRTVWVAALSVMTLATVALQNSPAPDIIYQTF